MRLRTHHIGLYLSLIFLASLLFPAASIGSEPWVSYEGQNGPGSGRHIVLISGDEEYRSEEALPQFAQILAKHHGFRCTVLFAIDPESGVINPNILDNIPGLQALKSADLMIVFTRFRALPHAQMQLINDYLKSGRPVFGIRTATHAFQFNAKHPWARYSNSYRGEDSAWTGGFGRLVLGEKWINHYGHHKHESTRGIVAPDARDHAIARGLENCDIWGPTDVYEVRLPLPGDATPIVLGRIIQRTGKFEAQDPFYGMRPDDGPALPGKKNNPMMPIAWTKTYKIPEGKPGRAFASTLGAATDLVSEGTRRLWTNAVYWTLGMGHLIPDTGTRVDLVGTYKPTGYGNHPNTYWLKQNVKPSDLAWDTTKP
jgi:hypothetical protein